MLTLLLVHFLCGFSNALVNTHFAPNSKALPENLIVGYAANQECDDKLIKGVQDGVNVLVWFAINLAHNQQTGAPEIQGGPDMDCVASVVKSIADLKLDVVHLISIGGWDAPHPDTRNSAEAMYNALDLWNRNASARPEKGFLGFDGFDWDIEGNDITNSPYNTFTVECLDLMGQISVFAKSRGQYIVSMAPPESYLDPTTNEFDRTLLHTYPEWNFLNPPFAYHGRNCYAYLISKYGKVSVKNQLVDTFDYVFVQLYETYSHADFYIYEKGNSARDYFTKLVNLFLTGWQVDFSSDPAVKWPSQKVQLSAKQIVIGLANGWAGAGKVLLVYPEDIQTAYEYMKSLGIAPRGFGFWDILNEGKISPQKPGIPVYLAAGLNKFLHTRNNTGENDLFP